MQPTVSKVSGAIFINPQHQKSLLTVLKYTCVINTFHISALVFFPNYHPGWIILILIKPWIIIIINSDSLAREF